MGGERRRRGREGRIGGGWWGGVRGAAALEKFRCRSSVCCSLISRFILLDWILEHFMLLAHVTGGLLRCAGKTL